MFRDPVHLWLLSLCDPNGCVDPPGKRLRPQQAVQLLELAFEHGVTGALLANLETLLEREGRSRLLDARWAGDHQQVTEALAEARRQWFQFVAMTLCLRHRAVELTDVLGRRQLPVTLIKGEDFTDRLYPQPALRPFRDIDLMLPREALSSAAEIMPDLGYEEVLPDVKYDEGYGERTWDSVSKPTVRVELHWNLINSPSQRRESSVAYEDLQRQEVLSGGRQWSRPTPASMLLIAAVHAVLGHRFDRLQHLCDIRQICRNAAGRVDVDWLREAVQRTGTSAALQAGLEVTSRLLDDPASRDVLDQLQLPVPTHAWRWLVGEATLLRPYTAVNKLRRTALREWMKRAA
jgi:hypothetical protein